MEKLKLLEYLSLNGKDKTWRELALEYGFSSDDAARGFVRRNYTQLKPKEVVPTYTSSFTESNRELWIKNVLYPYPPEPDEVIRDHKIDTTKYKLNQFWSKSKPELGGYFVSASFLHLDYKEDFTNLFLNFLKSYNPPPISWDIKPDYKNLTYFPGTVILNKQDSHINKLCVQGSNDLVDRLKNIWTKTVNLLARASVNSKLDSVIYVLGSDYFNSEWNKATTRGTPQENLLDYFTVFDKVCQFELEMIRACLTFAKSVHVVYVPGNHDMFVGWHLVHWLEAVFKQHESVTFDCSKAYTKYIQVYDSAIALNHGYDIKLESICRDFPVEYKSGFANSNYYYVLTGDKHVEESKSIGAIKCYQIPALSRAKSDWDMQKGYAAGVYEMTLFGIEPNKGINLILKEPM